MRRRWMAGGRPTGSSAAFTGLWECPASLVCSICATLMRSFPNSNTWVHLSSISEAFFHHHHGGMCLFSFVTRRLRYHSYFFQAISNCPKLGGHFSVKVVHKYIIWKCFDTLGQFSHLPLKVSKKSHSKSLRKSPKVPKSLQKFLKVLKSL